MPAGGHASCMHVFVGKMDLELSFHFKVEKFNAYGPNLFAHPCIIVRNANTIKVLATFRKKENKGRKEGDAPILLICINTSWRVYYQF